MKQRFAVRRPFDKDQIFCLVEKESNDQIVCLKLDEDGLEIEHIFESPNTKIIALEADPENKK